MDTEGTAQDLLHAHGLKKTPIRLEMLDLFLKHDFALSASDLIGRMKTGIDRVTVYRALASFEEQGILHKASEDRQGVKYAICSHRHADKSGTHRHAHFVCVECHQTYCLEDVAVPEVEVSSEFSVASVDYTLSGICKHCKGLT